MNEMKGSSPRWSEWIVIGTVFLSGCALMSHRQSREEVSQPLFYSDLGPAAIDVSGYPAKQKENYAVYARACSQCHTLARSINAPVVSPAFWEFYILSMRARSRFTPGTRITKDEVLAIRDFLAYDSKIRKVDHKEEFERRSEQLKDRFDLIVADRLHLLEEDERNLLNPPVAP